ncbi:hypothetical protein [Arsenicicoccus piscis]|uniref:MacB-like periplasmic core domain-containing protein n=1 Tax=Arsenicicoccus piscis TaxID=673954 RepID=A0ABQ6HSA7_9MICO|nr:hypothetical protein [Arsenicicoccus piscis]GMA20733.1 hypothetical protein GCM10025862_27540 [Arsenicicoccus piscis]
MLRASWKSLLGRKLRLLMSAFAIVLGVAFVSGSLIFTDMIGTAFNGIMNGSVADVNVQAKGSGDNVETSVVREISPEVLAKVREVPGCSPPTAASPTRPPTSSARTARSSPARARRRSA